MDEPVRPKTRYKAFLSYSHRDATGAARLHRRLETYRLPKRLTGSKTARGVVPARLWPIFRDREELPAASDLSETVRAALAESGALIILCSPQAAPSLWVTEEIETFRRLYPDRPILAAILDGDPPDCFPAALRAVDRDGTWHEPLATDLRPGRDGAHLGLLKLVAGITGVGLDDLAQRDATRRVRRVMAVTGAAMLAMLVMAALAVIALTARGEAERQRLEAEGQRAEVGRQIEFLITDLRDRLRGVGRLDILDVVNQHALDYYQGQRLEGLDAGSLERRAAVLRAIGEDELARGRLAIARSAFGEAYRTTAERLARTPRDPASVHAHAQSENSLGEVHAQLHEWPEALRYFMRSMAAAQRLVGVAPDDPNYMMAAGYGALNVGRVQLQGYDEPAAAQASVERALLWFQRARRARPGDWTARRMLADANGLLADTYNARHLWRAALNARKRAYVIYRPLYNARSGDMDFLYDVTRAEYAFGQQLSILGERDAAKPYFLSAYRHARILRDHDPDNAIWLVLNATIECDLLHGSPGQGVTISRARLRRSIMAAITELTLRRHPGAASISRCLSGSGPRPTARP